MEAGTCVQSPFMLLLALKGINHRVKQSSHPEFSQNSGTCLHPSAHAWKCSVEAMQVVRLCPGSHQFPGLPPALGSCLLLPHRNGNQSRGCALITVCPKGVCLCGVSVLQGNESFWSPQREQWRSDTLQAPHTHLFLSSNSRLLLLSVEFNSVYVKAEWWLTLHSAPKILLERLQTGWCWL